MLRHVDFVVVVEGVEVESQQATPVSPSFVAIRWVLRTPFLEGAQGVVVVPRFEAGLADVGGGVVEEAEVGSWDAGWVVAPGYIVVDRP